MVAPHSAQGPVCSAAVAQLNASIPNFFIHEVFDEFNEPWEKLIVSNPVEVVDGYIEVSERPCLGIDHHRRITFHCLCRGGRNGKDRFPDRSWVKFAM